MQFICSVCVIIKVIVRPKQICSFCIGFYVLNQVLKKVADIYRDHVSEPLHSIYEELVKGRADVTDRKARLDAIESLKRMIRAWLDENYPKMEPDDRAARAEAMDISLIEQHMEGKLSVFVCYILSLVCP